MGFDKVTSEGDSEEDSDTMRLAEEIADYLDNREGAADSINGIVHWWLMRQRLEEAENRVKKAVALLKERGKVDVRVLPDGTEIYLKKDNNGNE